MRGDDRIEIGGVARAHGIRGEIVIVTHDPESTILGDVTAIWIGGFPRTIAGARATPDRGWLIQLEGIATRNDAELLRGQVVEVDRAAIPLDDGEFLLDDLIGCRVVKLDGTAWGEVASVELGLQDRLVIHDGGMERELPMVDQFVRAIDVEGGVITVDPPPGLPELPIAIKPHRPAAALPAGRGSRPSGRRG
jgi:16S rRNA processing protein RimM